MKCTRQDRFWSNNENVTYFVNIANLDLQENLPVTEEPYLNVTVRLRVGVTIVLIIRMSKPIHDSRYFFKK